MPTARSFAQLDVFSATPCMGNPVAIVLDGSGLAGEQRQRVARWTNLGETTFLLPPTQPETDYRLGIFTPGGELPFAGHPTLEWAHAWLEAGGGCAGQITISADPDGTVWVGGGTTTCFRGTATI